MNIEQLKYLKNQLDKKFPHFIVLYDLDNINDLSNIKTLEEIKALENTEEIARQCENLIEKIAIFLSSKGIPYDQIAISSEIGFVCRPELAYKLKKIPGNDVLSDIEGNISDTYMPVSFYIDTLNTGMKEITMDEYCFSNKINYLKDLQTEIKGIVNYQEFISKMEDLGYTIELFDYNNGYSINDCVKAVEETGYSTSLNIVADLKKEPVKTRKQ